MSSTLIDSLLAAAEEHQASDLFLQEGELPRLKIREQLVVVDTAPLSLADLTALWMACGADPRQDTDRDSGLLSQQRVRFRVNLHRTMGRLAAVLRRIKTDVPALDTLGVPVSLLTQWASRSFGLVLVTGPTGSGKSTTLAAMLQWMNQNLTRHIVTIEDPVEYIFFNDQSHFTQREVGRDTASFAHGLRSAMRQAPDVILVGEIRDFETALTALQAAETGHLVLATLHSERVADTIDRYYNLFTKDQLGYGANLLADHLIGILCQKLVPNTQGGLHLLIEHFQNGGATRDWIRRREGSSLNEYLHRSGDPACAPFLRSAVSAWKQGLITEEVAITALGNESEFRRAMRGIG